jgi:hypothetical protein
MKARIVDIKTVRSGDIFQNASDPERPLMNVTIETSDGIRGRMAFSTPRRLDEHSSLGCFWIKYGSTPMVGMEVEAYMSGRFPKIVFPPVIPYKKEI